MTYYISPYRRMRRMQDVMDRMMRESFVPAALESENRVHVPVDVQVFDNDFVIRALVPSLKSEDLDIQILGDTITIRGELKGVQDEGGESLINEIPTGRFQRVIRLPVPLEPAKAEAAIESGVLNLRVPKAEEARPKTIKVKAR